LRRCTPFVSRGTILANRPAVANTFSNIPLGVDRCALTDAEWVFDADAGDSVGKRRAERAGKN
jgi:hypothetical protein